MNYLNKAAISLFFFLLIITKARSQDNYLPGYIIDLKSDTTYGYINYQNWDRNPEEVRFRSSAEQAEVKYRPGKIAEFSVAGELYRSALVDIEMSPYRTSEIDFDPTLNVIKDTVFVQVILDGEKDLCYFKAVTGKPQFYISQDGEYDLLLFKKFYSGSENASQTANRVIAYNNKYVGQLILFLTNCPGIQEKLYSVKYSLKDLQKIFEYYYECVNLDITYEKKAEKTKLEWSALAGPIVTSINFNGSASFDYLINGDFSPSYFFAAGMALDAVFPRTRDRWSINTEALLTSFKSDGYWEDIESQDKYTKMNMEVGATYLKLNLMARFKYPVKKTWIFANAGISNGFMLAMTNYAEIEKKFYADPEVTEENVLPDTRNYEVGIIAGLGIRFNHFSAELRYEGSTGMSPYTLMTSRIQRGFLLIGYMF